MISIVPKWQSEFLSGGESVFHVKLEVCRRSVELLVNVIDSYMDDKHGLQIEIDLSPVSSSFAFLEDFDIYCDLEIDQLVSRGSSDIRNRMKSILTSISSKYIRDRQKYFDTYIDMSLEMLDLSKIPKEDVTLWCWNERSIKLVLIEIPFITNADSTTPELQYLVSVVRDDMPTLCIVLNSAAEKFEVFLRSSKQGASISKLIEFPKITIDFLLGNYISDLRSQFSVTWRFRKSYIEELSRLCCVTEFQPTDFSFVSLLIRLKHNKLFTLFVSTIRISGPFPKFPPVLTVYDLQSSSIVLVEQSEFPWDSKDSAKCLACKTLLFICNMMKEKTFSVK